MNFVRFNKILEIPHPPFVLLMLFSDPPDTSKITVSVQINADYHVGE